MTDGGNQTRETEILVVGGGIVGTAAALALADAGRSVVLLERGALAPATGSSKGAARIICPSAYPDRDYLAMGLRAAEGWREIERRSGTDLLLETGVLSVSESIHDELAELQELGVDAGYLDPAVARRELGIRCDDGRPLLFQPRAGIVRAASAHAALIRLLREAQVELRERDPVLRIGEPGAERVEVESESGRWLCGAILVAAGPWSRELLADTGVSLPVTISSQTVAYFGLRDAARPPTALIDYDNDEPYALFDPAFGLKAALHRRGVEVDPGEPAAIASDAAIEPLRDWVGERYDERVTGIIARETCIYTNTADERFHLTRNGRLAVASACSGHGFQFAPETGRRAAALTEEALG